MPNSDLDHENIHDKMLKSFKPPSFPTLGKKKRQPQATSQHHIESKHLRRS